ncbi:CapA family protein [Candidatus Margulisiibacteriota bacterium]
MKKNLYAYLTVAAVSLAVLIVGAIFVVKSHFIRTLHFVPVTCFNSLRINFEPQARLITLRKYYYDLEKHFPDIKDVRASELNKWLDKDYVALLPWWEVDARYKTLKVNGCYFYEKEQGFVPVKKLASYVPVFNQNKVTEIAAGGTVVLARGVARSIEKISDPLQPWYGTKNFFRKADFSIVNFKSPLVYNYTKPESKWHLYGKAQYAAGLTFAGIDLVSISGNHMGDAGREGLLETIDILKKARVAPVGAGQDMYNAYKPHFWQKNGIKFGFLAFNSVVSSIVKAKAKGDPEKRIGIAWLDNDALKAVKKAKRKADVMVVIVNWGKEYMAKPEEKEVIWARKLVNAGADIVLGDQAHWVQNYEFYEGSFIAYGLGNFIFDQYWSEKTKEGILQKHVFYDKKHIAVETIPIKLRNYARVEPVKDKKTYFEILKQFYGFE